MICLNQAATTYPKPQCVLTAHAAALENPPSAQFRSAGSLYTKDCFEECREKLALLFGLQEKERIFFSSGATDSLNRVILGILPLCAGRHKIITTVTEHNSVLRPLLNHPEFAGNTEFLACDEYGYINPKSLQDALSPEVSAVIVNHCSNVTGMIQDMEQISKIIKEYDKQILLIVDVSQSAGCIPIMADKWNADALIFTGHKGLFGVQGTGGYYVRKGVKCVPLLFGGTGRNSAQLTYEDEDYEYEVGTQNAPGIAALLAGVNWVLNYGSPGSEVHTGTCIKGIDRIQTEEQRLMKTLYQGLSALPHIKLYGSAETNKGPVMSFNVEGLKPSDVGYILQSVFDITVRTGLHCAPLIHKYLGTDTYGTIRVSISAVTREEEIDAFLHSMSQIVESLQGHNGKA